MKQILTLILIIVSLSAGAQGNSKPVPFVDNGMNSSRQDTAAQRKEIEAANKFVSELVQKTSIADFQKWVYENLPAKKNDEFIQLYNYFIQQKYLATKTK